MHKDTKKGEKAFENTDAVKKVVGNYKNTVSKLRNFKDFIGVVSFHKFLDSSKFEYAIYQEITEKIIEADEDDMRQLSTTDFIDAFGSLI